MLVNGERLVFTFRVWVMSLNRGWGCRDDMDVIRKSLPRRSHWHLLNLLDGLLFVSLERTKAEI